jgi:hypothetical protein
MIDLRTVGGSQVSLAGLAPITDQSASKPAPAKKNTALTISKRETEDSETFNLTVTRLPNLNLFLETPYAGVARMPVSLHIL